MSDFDKCVAKIGDSYFLGADNKFALKRLYGYESLGLTPEELAAQAIQRVATIDPVRHGRWIVVCADDRGVETEIEEQCALCGRVVCRYDTQPQDNYCPTCGAKMDGGDER